LQKALEAKGLMLRVASFGGDPVEEEEDSFEDIGVDDGTLPHESLH